MNKRDGRPSEVTLGILAGGRGIRLGGREKGLIEVGGQCLVAHVVDRLAASASRTLISANREHRAYEALADEVFADEVGSESSPGPVAGVITLLRHCQTTWLQLAPCDAPLLPPDLTARLRRVTTDSTAVVPRADDRHQWACSLLSRSGLPALEEAFAAGTRSLGSALRALGYSSLDWETPIGAFTNINTPEELAQLRARLASGEPSSG
jgi:molybdopterin-guanine dinucleotide biosynthesis protein A